MRISVFCVMFYGHNASATGINREAGGYWLREAKNYLVNKGRRARSPIADKEQNGWNYLTALRLHESEEIARQVVTLVLAGRVRRQPPPGEDPGKMFKQICHHSQTGRRARLFEPYAFTP